MSQRPEPRAVSAEGLALSGMTAGTSLKPNPASLGLRWRAWAIAGGYAVIATLWIYFSDQALGAIVADPQTLLAISVYKGLGFVMVTALLLLLLMWRSFSSIEAGYTYLKQTEQRLRVSEEQLASVIRSAIDAIIAVDEQGRILVFNAAAERMFQCAHADAIGQPFERFIEGPLPHEDRSFLRARGLRRDGRPFPIEASVSLSASSGQAFTTLIVRDISRRLARQEEIQRLSRLYSALSQINQAIARTGAREDLFDTVCRVLVEQGNLRMAWIGWVNERTHRVEPAARFGDRNDYLGSISIYADDRPEGRGPTGTAIREARAYICNDMMNDPSTLPWRERALADGFLASAVFPIRCRDRVVGALSVYADSQGFFLDKEIALLAGAAADISFALDTIENETERRAAEELAHNERQFSDTMIESMPGILYFYTEAGRFVRWNRNFERVSGYGPAELSGMSPLDFFGTGDKDALQQRIDEVFENGESFVEAPFVAKDGTATPYFFTGRRVEFQGQPCLVGMGIDISERVEAERALRELNETLELRVEERTRELEKARVRAESADRLKSAFLATMSHELRTPLNSIIGFTGIVLQGLAGPLNDEQTKQMRMVQASARHLLALINDVLDLSKIEAGELRIHAVPFALGDAIDSALGMIRPLADAKRLTLHIDAPDSLGEMTGDRRRVEQILINLLNNAVKFTDRGTVGLSAARIDDYRRRSDASPEPAVRCLVSDTGIGIRPEDLARLFQPFHQLDTGLSRQHEGTGLGLAICRRLAELMGGQISAASEWGKGSSFTVTLPLRQEAA